MNPSNTEKTVSGDRSQRRAGSAIGRGLALLALATSGVAVAPAHAGFDQKATLRDLSFSVEVFQGEPIRVISTDGKKWDKFADGTVPMVGQLSMRTAHPGYVESVAIRLGSCHGSICGYAPILWGRYVVERRYTDSTRFHIGTAQLPIASGNSIPLDNSGGQILARCNQNLQPDGPTRAYRFKHQMAVTLTVETDKSYNLAKELRDLLQADFKQGSIHYDKSRVFTVDVVCAPVIKPSAGDLALDHGAFAVEDVKLFLTTYRSNQPGPNPGEVCSALKVTSRAETNKAGPVKMRIWRQKGNEPITSEVKDTVATYDAAKNGYFATYEKFETVSATSYFQYKTEIVDGTPFGPTDGWKDITVHCTNPGGGGVTIPQPPNDQTPKPKWTGTLSVSDSAGRNKSCPRKALVAFNVQRPAPGNFNYRIQCSNGAFFLGEALAVNQQQGNFGASGTHEISINHTRKIQCTLQELQPVPVTVAKGDESFTCNNPAIDTGPGSLVNDTVPPAAQPGTAPTSCRPNQRLVRGRCLDNPVAVACKPNEKRAGNRCVPVSIHCLPGLVQVGLQCVAKPGSGPVACKPNQIRRGKSCVAKPEVAVPCKKGFVLQGKTCVRSATIDPPCPRGQKKIRGECVRRVPTVVKPGKQRDLVAPKPGRPHLKGGRMESGKLLPMKEGAVPRRIQ